MTSRSLTVAQAQVHYVLQQALHLPGIPRSPLRLHAHYLIINLDQEVIRVKVGEVMAEVLNFIALDVPMNPVVVLIGDVLEDVRDLLCEKQAQLVKESLVLLDFLLGGESFGWQVLQKSHIH